ncbi:6203_t:CDS:2, partial [Entrophospora sp. SA101]
MQTKAISAATVVPNSLKGCDGSDGNDGGSDSNGGSGSDNRNAIDTS